MKRIIFLFVVLAVFAGFDISGQDGGLKKGLEMITENAVKGQLDFLASDWMEGRATGEKGGFMAADYIASMFSLYGLEPCGDHAWDYPSSQERIDGKRAMKYTSYFQDFQLIKSVPGKDQEMAIINTNANGNSLILNYKTDYDIGEMTVGKEFTAGIVFAGYGISDEDKNYDDYKGVDATGKVAVVLSGFPGHQDTSSTAYKKFKPEGNYGWYRLRNSKAVAAAKHGALAIIILDLSGKDIFEDFADNLPFRVNRDYYEGEDQLPSIYDYDLSLPADTMELSPVEVTLSRRASNYLLDGSGLDLDNYEETVAKTMKPASKVLEGKNIRLKTTVDSEVITARNVVGMIRGKDTAEVIVAGAHYDHLGMHGGYVWNGADDNASGTVGIMTIARAFALSGEIPEKTLVFAAWTGEEKGLLGSSWFVENVVPKGSRVIMNLNYDMISRDSKNDSLGVECSMFYLDGHEYLEELSEKNNEDFELGLKIRYRSSSGRGGGSDYAPFSRKGIPFFYYMAGWHADYHNPTDHARKANIDKMTRIVKLGYLDLYTIANNEIMIPEKTGDHGN